MTIKNSYSESDQDAVIEKTINYLSDPVNVTFSEVADINASFDDVISSIGGGGVYSSYIV